MTDPEPPPPHPLLVLMATLGDCENPPCSPSYPNPAAQKLSKKLSKKLIRPSTSSALELRLCSIIFLHRCSNSSTSICLKKNSQKKTDVLNSSIFRIIKTMQ